MDHFQAVSLVQKLSWTFKKYTTILVLGKPLSIFVYSYGVAKLLEFFFQIIA
jgi:uncharacterized membrane protein YdjX (TVP38/TMEM64 family)